jgi:hypothetical protein
MNKSGTLFSATGLAGTTSQIWAGFDLASFIAPLQCHVVNLGFSFQIIIVDGPYLPVYSVWTTIAVHPIWI